MISKDSKIVILGAGIGGLTIAIALRQRGFKNISLYERRKKTAPLGAGIVLWSNATKILHKLGLLKAVDKVGGKLEQMQRWTEAGEFLGAIDINIINTTIGATSYSISRSDLQNILLQKVKELNITINYKHNATRISNQFNTTDIHFETNNSVKAAIIIGADGRMKSIARHYVNGNNAPVYQNFVNWIGLLESETPIFPEHNVLDFWGCGERFGIVPINTHKGYWAGGKSLPQNSTFKDVNNKTQLLETFGSWSPNIKKIIELTKEENIKYIEVFDHNPIPKWYKNNVCLIGDSAHAALPTSGQGACQAIEDAWHLACTLGKSETLEKAFIEFQNIRFEKTTTITMVGRALATSLFNEDVAFCANRNESAKQSNYELANQNIAKLWSK